MTQFHPNSNYPAPQPTPHRAKTPWYKRTWVLLVATGFVCLGIGGAAGGGSKKAADAHTVTATATTTTVSTAPAPPAGTVTVKPTIVKVIKTKTETRTKTYTPPPKPSFSDGKYEVGSDIKSGQYRTDGDGDCYYEIDNDLDGGIESIDSNENFSGPQIVHLRSGQYFEVSGGCDWRQA